MPFDGTKFTPQPMTRLRKLEILLEIAERAKGNQHTFCECLFHDVVADGRLSAAGMPCAIQASIPVPTRATYDWFGNLLDIPRCLFGGASIEQKRADLRAKLSRERALIGESVDA